MSKLKRIFRNPRVILLIVFLILAFLFINPTTGDGVAIRNVEVDSAAAEASPVPIESPDPNIKPRNREIIEEIDGFEITTLDDYAVALSTISVNQTLTIVTDRNTYFVTVRADEDGNPEDIGLRVFDKPSNNVRRGLDIAGGTRVFLEPDEPVSGEDLSLIMDNLRQRLDVFGLGDVTVRSASDLFGNSFIVVEIAGVNEDEIVELLSRQGVFEAKIGNETVFRGGDQDIISIDRRADRTGIEPGSCRSVGDRYVCNFRFGIVLSREAAERQAALTRDLDIVSGGVSGNYLSENLTLFLDGVLVNELTIAEGLRGNPVRDIQISGSGSGPNRQAAEEDALNNMRQLQTVIATGSLPVQLNIEKVDNISPAVGSEFLRNAVLAGLVALLVVITTVSLRYREYRIAVPMSITLVSEVVLLLGVAALINWSIDMAAVAAIIIAVGSGVDHQIVIAEETLERGRRKDYKLSWAKRLAKAFFIIMAAYFTLVVAMIPLWFAGAGLLRGFALTTVIGVTLGVLITRPAFAAIMEILVNDDD